MGSLQHHGMLSGLEAIQLETTAYKASEAMSRIVERQRCPATVATACESNACSMAGMALPSDCAVLSCVEPSGCVVKGLCCVMLLVTNG